MEVFVTALPTDELRLKALFKEVLSEVLDQRRDWFLDLVAEAIEDVALVYAIKAGEATETVGREEIFALLGGKA
jgi:hypothetical protein